MKNLGKQRLGGSAQIAAAEILDPSSTDYFFSSSWVS